MIIFNKLKFVQFRLIMLVINRPPLLRGKWVDPSVVYIYCLYLQDAWRKKSRRVKHKIFAIRLPMLYVLVLSTLHCTEVFCVNFCKTPYQKCKKLHDILTIKKCKSEGKFIFIIKKTKEKFTFNSLSINTPFTPRVVF